MFEQQPCHIFIYLFIYASLTSLPIHEKCAKLHGSDDFLGGIPPTEITSQGNLSDTLKVLGVVLGFSAVKYVKCIKIFLHLKHSSKH